MAMIPGTGGSGTTFEPVPAGVHLGILAQVRCLQENYRGTPKTNGRFIFQTPRLLDEKGIPKEVRFTCGWTMGRQPNGQPTKMRAFLSQWRGREITDAEAATLDLEQLIGVPCVFETTVQQSQTNPGRTFARIERIRAATAQEAAGAAVVNYVPEEQRKSQQATQQQPAAAPDSSAAWGPGPAAAPAQPAAGGAWGKPGSAAQPAGEGHPGADDEPIPFAWVVPFVLPLLSMVV